MRILRLRAINNGKIARVASWHHVLTGFRFFLLPLGVLHAGVFIKVSKATAELLLRVEPYITYGT